MPVAAIIVPVLLAGAYIPAHFIEGPLLLYVYIIPHSTLFIKIMTVYTQYLYADDPCMPKSDESIFSETTGNPFGTALVPSWGQTTQILPGK